MILETQSQEIVTLPVLNSLMQIVAPALNTAGPENETGTCYCDHNLRASQETTAIIYPKHEQVEVEKFPRRENSSSDFILQMVTYKRPSQLRPSPLHIKSLSTTKSHIKQLNLSHINHSMLKCPAGSICPCLQSHAAPLFNLVFEYEHYIYLFSHVFFL